MQWMFAHTPYVASLADATQGIDLTSYVVDVQMFVILIHHQVNASLWPFVFLNLSQVVPHSFSTTKAPCTLTLPFCTLASIESQWTCIHNNPGAVLCKMLKSMEDLSLVQKIWLWNMDRPPYLRMTCFWYPSICN